MPPQPINTMRVKHEIQTEGVAEGIKRTFANTSIPLYDWMLDTNLHQCDLLVYAAIFDILKDHPLQPQHINLSDVAKRIKYTPDSVYGSVILLRNLQMLFTQGEGKNILYSIYPFNTLDLK